MRQENIPLFALESQEPIKNFDFLGITIQYEMCYTNILADPGSVRNPLLAAERTDADPIVIEVVSCLQSGTACGLFDLFLHRRRRNPVPLFDGSVSNLQKTGQKPGSISNGSSPASGYVCTYSLLSGHLSWGWYHSFFFPCQRGDPGKNRKRTGHRSLAHAVYPEHPVVPFIKVTQDRVVLEIQRGCIRGCRFCQAGQLYRPVRRT